MDASKKEEVYIGPNKTQIKRHYKIVLKKKFGRHVREGLNYW